MDIPDSTTVKQDFISLLIRNQCNPNLLEYSQKDSKKPLNVSARLADPNEYIRRVSNIKIFEHLNLEGIIRGPKQKEVLMPTKYTQPLDEHYMSTFKGCVIGSNC